LDKDLRQPEISLDESEIQDNELQIEIQDNEKCHRYVGKLIRDVEIKESPAWLKNRLTAIGLRPINNVVDVTNYVMHELGQPLHAFDYDEVAGKKIVVQSFEKEISFTTLDDAERKIPANTLFICDGEKPVAIAGVMGGQNSEVSDKTTNILLESAYFVPTFVRKASKNLSLQTDSSYRFERGIDPNITSIAAHRAAALIAEVSGGTVVEGTMDIHPVKTESLKLHLRQNFLNRMLGTNMESEQAARILHKLGFRIIEWTSFEVVCEVPTFRPDIEREIDLVEEIGRIIDYNSIPAPKTAHYLVPAPIPFHEQFLQKVSKAAQLAGFREIYTNSLLPHDKALRFAGENELVETLNPVSQEMTTLRPGMMHGMLTAMAYNFNRNAKTLKFFEIGHTFRKSDTGNWVDGVQEDISLILAIGGLSGNEHWDQKPRNLTAFDLKSSLISILDALGIDFSEEADEENGLIYKNSEGAVIGSLKEVDSALRKVYDFDRPVFAAELNLSLIENKLKATGESSLKPIPRFPAFEFDLAVVVGKDVPASGLLAEIKETAGPTLSSIEIFDVFESESIGEGNKSLAFRLHFIDPNKTLNIKDVEPIIGKVLKSLEHKFSAKLRS
jgi:phenylalanyl-tRNA synthetase beta chain